MTAQIDWPTLIIDHYEPWLVNAHGAYRFYPWSRAATFPSKRTNTGDTISDERLWLQVEASSLIDAGVGEQRGADGEINGYAVKAEFGNRTDRSVDTVRFSDTLAVFPFLPDEPADVLIETAAYHDAEQGARRFNLIAAAQDKTRFGLTWEPDPIPGVGHVQYMPPRTSTRDDGTVIAAHAAENVKRLRCGCSGVVFDFSKAEFSAPGVLDALITEAATKFSDITCTHVSGRHADYLASSATRRNIRVTIGVSEPAHPVERGWDFYTPYESDHAGRGQRIFVAGES